MSRELVRNAFYRDTHRSQAAINSYFKWRMILLICYSTVTFSYYQCKAMAKDTINLCCPEAWHLKDCDFRFISSAFFRKQITTGARKRSQKQHKDQGKLQSKTGTTKLPVVLERPLISDFLKPHGKINTFPSQSRAQSIWIIIFFLADLIYVGRRLISLEKNARNGLFCSKVLFQNSFPFRRPLSCYN